jgi:multidrug resistance efflux pump
MMKKVIYILIALSFVVTGVASACANQAIPTEQNQTASGATVDAVPADAVIAEGHLEPARDTTLSFQGTGTVMEVAVKIGDKVREGDVLARLGGQSDGAYAAAQLELVSAQQALKDLQDTASEAHAQALIALDDAQEAYDKAVDYYDTLFEPYEFDQIVYIRKVTPFGVKRIPTLKTIKVDEADEETIAEAQNDMDLKLARLEAAQRASERVKDGPDTDQLALLQARLNAAKAAVAAFAVVAPFDGVVMDLNVAAGEQVGPQTWVAKIADTSSWYIKTSDVTELEVVNIVEGQEIKFTADALPEVSMQGTVEEVSQASYTQSGDVIYIVRIKVNEIDPRLKWGMTVEVVFEPQEN